MNIIINQDKPLSIVARRMIHEGKTTPDKVALSINVAAAQWAMYITPIVAMASLYIYDAREYIKKASQYRQKIKRDINTLYRHTEEIEKKFIMVARKDAGGDYALCNLWDERDTPLRAAVEQLEFHMWKRYRDYKINPDTGHAAVKLATAALLLKCAADVDEMLHSEWIKTLGYSIPLIKYNFAGLRNATLQLARDITPTEVMVSPKDMGFFREQVDALYKTATDIDEITHAVEKYFPKIENE